MQRFLSRARTESADKSPPGEPLHHRGDDSDLYLLSAYAQHLNPDVVIDADDFAYSTRKYQHDPSPWLFPQCTRLSRCSSESVHEAPASLLATDRGYYVGDMGNGNPLLIEDAACLGLAVGLPVHPARSALPDGHWLIQHAGSGRAMG